MKPGQDSYSRPSEVLLILRALLLSNASCSPSSERKEVIKKKKVIVLIFLSARDQQTFSAKDQVVNSSSLFRPYGHCHYDSSLLLKHDIDDS